MEKVYVVMASVNSGKAVVEIYDNEEAANKCAEYRRKSYEEVSVTSVGVSSEFSED